MNSRLSTIEDWEGLARKADFNAVQLASLCHVSSRQLERFFQQTVHLTPSQWLRCLQCVLAGELLARGYSTKAVAAELKFANASHFCHVFKKHFGVAPGNFASVCPKVGRTSIIDNNVVYRQSIPLGDPLLSALIARSGSSIESGTQ